MTPCSKIPYIRFARGRTTPNPMMSHWERKWDSAQAYLSLPVCRGFDPRTWRWRAPMSEVGVTNGLGAEVPRRLTLATSRTSVDGNRMSAVGAKADAPLLVPQP